MRRHAKRRERARAARRSHTSPQTARTGSGSEPARVVGLRDHHRDAAVRPWVQKWSLDSPTDVRICRIAGVAQAHTHASFGIFDRSSTATMIVDWAASFRYQGKLHAESAVLGDRIPESPAARRSTFRLAPRYISWLRPGTAASPGRCRMAVG